ncbi:hypothetical protein C7E25_25180, partial [Stenotrophomonas maltophilia]
SRLLAAAAPMMAIASRWRKRCRKSAWRSSIDGQQGDQQATGRGGADDGDRQQMAEALQEIGVAVVDRWP